MRKRAREKILPIPQIYEQERRKMLITGLDVEPADIAQHLKLFNGFRSQLYKQRRYLIPQTPAAARDIRSEMNGVQRQLVIILFLLMILLKVALVLLCLELSLISNVYVVVVLYPWTAHSKWVLVYFTSFTSSILIATIQYFQNFFVYYQINRQQHITVYFP